jgi:hypothetical protein
MRYAFIAGVITLALGIAAYTQPWYYIKTGDEKYQFNWKQLTSSGVGDTENTKYTTLNWKQVQQTFDSMLSFLTIGLGICIGVIVVEFLVVCFMDRKMNSMFKMLLVLATIAVTVMLAICFFTTFNINKALK